MESTELDFRGELDRLTGQLQEALADVIRTTDDRIALPPGAQTALAGFHQPLPDTGCGASAAIEELMRLNEAAGGNTQGPRCYHFVLGGSTPAVVVVNAGEVNAGEFDPVADMIALARRSRCWVHVDGAFGLFARLSPRTAHFVEGVERADSATVDGHKWLNVPYDSGYAFVRDHAMMAKAFRYSADYLPAEDDVRPTFGAIGPESSRRARSFAVWATLKAYGRQGHRQIVEHCLDIAAHFAEVVRRTPQLELMNDPRLNIVAFRYNPGGLASSNIDALNQRLGAAMLKDGRFLVGTSRLGARTVFRPAFSNWRTRTEDVEELARVVVKLGQRERKPEGKG